MITFLLVIYCLFLKKNPQLEHLFAANGSFAYWILCIKVVVLHSYVVSTLVAAKQAHLVSAFSLSNEQISGVNQTSLEL